MGELFPGSSCLPGHKLCSTSARRGGRFSSNNSFTLLLPGSEECAASVAACITHGDLIPSLEPRELPLRSEPMAFPPFRGSGGQTLLSCRGRRFRDEDSFCATLPVLSYDPNARQLFANRRRCRRKN